MKTGIVLIPGRDFGTQGSKPFSCRIEKGGFLARTAGGRACFKRRGGRLGWIVGSGHGRMVEKSAWSCQVDKYPTLHPHYST